MGYRYERFVCGRTDASDCAVSIRTGRLNDALVHGTLRGLELEVPGVTFLQIKTTREMVQAQYHNVTMCFD